MLLAENLDQAIAMLLQEASGPLTIPELELLVATRTQIKADTYDVQRAVHRLLDQKKATLTPRLSILKT